jgi:hypothetical protein
MTEGEEPLAQHRDPVFADHKDIAFQEIAVIA